MTILAVAIATIGSFCLGTVLAWSAPTLEDRKFEEKFDIGNTGSASWVATCALLGAILSAPIAGFLNAKLGRKGTMIATAIPFTAGWALIAFASSVQFIYAGRFVTGLCGGGFTVSIPAYISEVTEDRNRGMMSVTFVLMINLGILFTYVFDAIVKDWFILTIVKDWFILTIVSGCFPILAGISILCMPESPRHLLMVRKPTSARKALKWLRRASQNVHVEPEINKIQNSVTPIAETKSDKGLPALKSVFQKSVLVPLVISVALMFFSQFSGMNGVLLYTNTIFEESGTSIEASYAAIVIGATQVVTVFIVPVLLVDRLGRCNLLIISQTVMLLSLLALGTFFQLRDNNGGITPENLGWLPLVALVLMTVGYQTGAGSIPWVIASEIVPSDMKEFASSVISICYWSLSFASGKAFDDLKNAIDYKGLYFVSSGVCLVGIGFVVLFVPETKGKTYEEIQKLFDSTAFVQSGTNTDKTTTAQNSKTSMKNTMHSSKFDEV